MMLRTGPTVNALRVIVCHEGWLTVLFSAITPAGSTGVQEHGQIYHPPGCCAAL